MEAEILTQLVWIKWLLIVVALAAVTVAGVFVWIGKSTRHLPAEMQSKVSFHDQAKALLDGGKVRDTLAGDPLASFIEDLRDYCVHKSPIGIITHHRLGKSDVSNSTYIHKSSILSWESLSAGGKPYLARHQSDIPIMEPITEYKEKVGNFRYRLRRILEGRSNVVCIDVGCEGRSRFIKPGFSG
jgi:hypothetical protein